MNQNWQHIAYAFEKIFGVLNQQIQLQAQADLIFNRCPCVRKHDGQKHDNRMAVVAPPSRARSTYDYNPFVNPTYVSAPTPTCINMPPHQVTEPHSGSAQSGNFGTSDYASYEDTFDDSNVNAHNINIRDTNIISTMAPQHQNTEPQSVTAQSGNVHFPFPDHPYVTLRAPPSNDLTPLEASTQSVANRIIVPQHQVVENDQTFDNFSVDTNNMNRGIEQSVANRTIEPRHQIAETQSVSAQSGNLRTSDYASTNISSTPYRDLEQPEANGRIVPQHQVTEPQSVSAHSGNVHFPFPDHPYVSLRAPPSTNLTPFEALDHSVTERLIVPQHQVIAFDDSSANAHNINIRDPQNISFNRTNQSVTNEIIVSQSQVTEPSLTSQNNLMPDPRPMGSGQNFTSSVQSQLQNESMPTMASISHSSIVTHSVEVEEVFELNPDDNVS